MSYVACERVLHIFFTAYHYLYVFFYGIAFNALRGVSKVIITNLDTVNAEKNLVLISLDTVNALKIAFNNSDAANVQNIVTYHSMISR